MYFQKRGRTYSFIYYDTKLKKNARLPRDQTPHILTDAQAEAFCQRWSIKYDAMKSRVLKKLAWQNKYANFSKLLDAFMRAKKEDAPNSWDAQVGYLQYYVLPFFLDQKEEPNPELWHLHFEEFRSHLETIAPMKIKRKKAGLAYSTINHIIKALNSFMVVLKRRCLIDGTYKCRTFSQSKIRIKQEECVIPSSEEKYIYDKLKEIHELSADMFLIGLQTGLRLNEMLGLSLNDMFEGESPNETLKKILEPYSLKGFGYISLESQPALHQSPRDMRTGRVPRKPLKGKKRIDAESGRIIPIFCRNTWNALVRLWNQQHLHYLKKTWGPKPTDYLLFEGMTKNKFAHYLRIAQQSLRLPRLFTPHDLRHTYSTWLAEKTGGNYTVCRMILGHSKIDMTLRYVHMNARIRRSLEAELQLKKPMSTVEPPIPLSNVYELPLKKRTPRDLAHLAFK